MDKLQKKRIKRYISWISLVVLVAALAVMPLLASEEAEAEGPQASILSGTVETGTIHTGLFGGGTLTNQDAIEIKIPADVKITEFLVSNGDIVHQGDALATVDRVSLMSAITSVKETMDYLVEEMADVTDESADTKITAQAGGQVKVIYAEEGDNVQDVMLEHGALAVLSLDGMMAVDISRDTELTTGDTVTVILEDETEVSGRVASNMGGVLTVTIADDCFDVGQKVVVLSTDGQHIGAGSLYIHNAWKAVGYTGTVSKIRTSVNKEVSAGTTLMTLTDTEFNAQLESLLSQYRDYENLMLNLFRMYQSNTVTAPCDGKISGVEEDSLHLLSADGSGYRFSLLANAPGSDPDAGYDNHVGMISGMLGSKWLVRMNPVAQEVTDYMADMATVDTSEENMTYFTDMDMVTVYRLVDGQWEIGTAEVGDTLLFALGENGFVWAIHIASAAPETSEPTQPSGPALPTEPVDPTDPALPGDSTLPTEPSTDPENPTDPGTENTPSLEDQFGDFISGGGFGGMAGGGFGGTVQEETFELYDLEGSVLMSVTPQETITLTISIDEQDISHVELGMPVEITVAALKNAQFSATVTDIAGSGTNSGGSSKFSVELTLPLQENMLGGMSAVAYIPLSSRESIPVIPVAALVDKGSRCYVYTGYDEKNQVLINPVEVTVGVSDGQQAEILSGLSLGDNYWYTYYDVLEIDHSVESGISIP